MYVYVLQTTIQNVYRVHITYDPETMWVKTPLWVRVKDGGT